MTTPAQHEVPNELSGHHKHTYESLFSHPTPHNVEWHDLRSLLAALGDVHEEHNGNLKITRNGQLLTMHATSDKVASVDDVHAVRRFLEQSGSTIPRPAVPAGVQLVVLINHHEAKIYSTESEGSIPHKLVPYDPHGYDKHLRTEVPETAGKRVPERKSFYEAIAKTIRGAQEILIFGTGTGESSAMEHLVADLKQHHHDVANQIVGTIVIDEKHTTESELLAKAREFFGSR